MTADLYTFPKDRSGGSEGSPGAGGADAPPAASSYQSTILARCVQIGMRRLDEAAGDLEEAQRASRFVLRQAFHLCAELDGLPRAADEVMKVYDALTRPPGPEAA